MAMKTTTTSNAIPLGERRTRTIVVDLPHAAYERLAVGQRVKGSLVMDGPLGAHFTAYSPQKPPEKPSRVLRQPHGRVEVFADRVRLRLRVDRDEAVDPAEAIDREGYEASRFVEQNAWRPLGYEW